MMHPHFNLTFELKCGIIKVFRWGETTKRGPSPRLSPTHLGRGVNTTAMEDAHERNTTAG